MSLLLPLSSLPSLPPLCLLLRLLLLLVVYVARAVSTLVQVYVLTFARTTNAAAHELWARELWQEAGGTLAPAMIALALVLALVLAPELQLRQAWAPRPIYVATPSLSRAVTSLVAVARDGKLLPTLLPPPSTAVARIAHPTAWRTVLSVRQGMGLGQCCYRAGASCTE